MDDEVKKELEELARQIHENPRDKNRLLFEWVNRQPDQLEYRWLIYAIASERGEMNINITNSTVGNINLGQQIGHIEAIAKTIASKQGGDNQHFAEALRALTDAIKNAQELKDTDKVEAAQALSEIAEQGNVEPQKRSHGKLKALLAGFPTLIAGAAHLTKLWETWVRRSGRTSVSK